MSAPNGRLRIGRIPYINCYPVYGAVDRGAVPLEAAVVDGGPPGAEWPESRSRVLARLAQR